MENNRITNDIEDRKICWNDFKKEITNHLLFFYRGQSDSNWPLKTSYHRSPISKGIFNYWNEVQLELTYFLREHLLSIEKIYKRDSNLYLLSLLAFLQHHGYPTPLLDWTESPYIATYFAFSQLKPWRIDGDKYVAIYCLPWEDKKFKIGLEIEHCENIVDEFQKDSPLIYFFRCPPISNERSSKQQSWLMATNLENPISHLASNRQENNQNSIGTGAATIWRYLISHSEYTDVMRDLDKMNITSMTLFSGPDSICEHMKRKDEMIASQLI